MFALGLW